MSHNEFDHALGFWLHAAEARVRAAAQRVFAPFGVQLEHWPLLEALWLRDERTQGELAQLVLRDPPSTSRLVDGLVAGGLAARGHSQADRRRRVVVLTRAGRDLERRLRPAVRALVARWTRGVPASDLRITLHTLKALASNLDK